MLNRKEVAEFGEDGIVDDEIRVDAVLPSIKQHLLFVLMARLELLPQLHFLVGVIVVVGCLNPFIHALIRDLIRDLIDGFFIVISHFAAFLF